MENPELARIKKLLFGALDDKTFVQEIIDEHKEHEDIVLEVLKDTFAELLSDADPFERQMVTPEQFLDDPYFCGINPKTGIGVVESIFPKLREDFIEVHESGSTIQEVVLSGSIGWGKSFFIELGLLWQLYYLSCLKHPQRYYSLAPDSPLGIIIISVTERQGKKNIFDTMKGMISKIPYFRENFMFNEKKANDSLIFPKKIEIFPASSSHSSNIGLNLFAGGMDEANFFRKIKNSKRSESGSGIFDEARTLYRSLRRRLDSRFMKYGKFPGILYLGSSRVYPNDFTSEHIKQAEETFKRTKVKTVYIMDYNQWVVNRPAYSKEEFQVEIGELNRRSRIIGPHDKPVGKVINVPMDFYDKFEADIENSLRDIAGYGVHAIQPFIGNKDKIVEMFDDSLPRIFSVDLGTLSPKPEFLEKEYIMGNIQHPGKPRYIAMDIAYTKDSFGFGMGYIEGFKNMLREEFNNETQQMETFTEKLPICVIEMLLEIRPEKEYGEVELARVRHLIYRFKKHKYRVRRGSGDGFQSKDMEQQLKRNAIIMSYISMDKTTEPYETFRTALYDGRVKCVYHPKLEIELNELERDYSKRKIDHPVMGCFLGDTKIKLLNGTNVPISELVGEENVELYGCLKSGKVVPVIAKKIWETKKVTTYLEILLDSGEVVKCTPEHLFMLKNGKYKAAQDLTCEDSLMPLYTDHSGKYLRGYERTLDNSTGRWEYTHRVVDEYYNGKRPRKDCVVHHYDINPLNNSNVNLSRMTRAEHSRKHAFLNELGRKPEAIKKRVKSLKRNTRIRAGISPDSFFAPWRVRQNEKNHSPEERKQMYLEKNGRPESRLKSSEQAKKMNDGYWKTEEGRKRRAELSKTQLRMALQKRMDVEDVEWIARFDITKKYTGIQEICNIYGGSRKSNRRRLKAIGYSVPKKNQKLINDRDLEWLSKFDQSKKYNSIKEIQNIYGGTRLAIIRRINMIGFTNITTIPLNHKICDIKTIHVENTIPVYDIEVPDTDNFALTAGIFVHNSKDLADAVGSMVYNMHNDPLYGNDDLGVILINGEHEEYKTTGKITTGDKEKDEFLDWVSGLILK